MDVNFNAAGADDEDLLIALTREFYAVEHLAFDEAVARAALRQLLRDGALGSAYLIRSGEDAAGYVVLTFGFSLEFHGRDALVDELYLREQFRGKGLGRAALEFVEGVCRAEGIKAVHLEVDRVNARAQGIYRAAGYRDHDRYLLTKWVDEREGRRQAGPGVGGRRGGTDESSSADPRPLSPFRFILPPSVR